VRDETQWFRLEPYVKDIVGSFKGDSRVWVWDMYNEPANGVQFGSTSEKLGDITLRLLEKVFCWAREINPAQPLTVGTWDGSDALEEFAFSLSDIITFHSYHGPEQLRVQIDMLKAHERPVVCTEWMNRGNGSTVAACLPVLKENNVGAMHWGLVNGRTQTHLNWGHLPGQPEPNVWQHDLFRSSHAPYDAGEIVLFKKAIRGS
jgi:hypothetical protein